MYRPWTGMLLLGVVVVGVAPTPRTRAEEDKAPVRTEKLPADLELVFASGGSFLALRPGELIDSGPIKQMPPRMKRELERMAAEAQRFLGLPLTAVERVTFLLPDALEGNPIVLVRTIKDYDQDAVVKKTLGPDAVRMEHKGLPMFAQKDRMALSLFALDSQTFALGRVREIQQALDRSVNKGTPRPHRRAVDWAVEKHQVVVGATPQWLVSSLMWHKMGSSRPAEARPEANPIRRPDPNDKPPIPPDVKPDPNQKQPALRAVAVAEEKPVERPQERIEERRAEPSLDALLSELPPDLLPYKPLLQAKTLALAIDLGTESNARWQFNFADADAANDGETAARAALFVLREMLGRLPRELRVPPESMPKLMATIKVVQAAIRTATVKRAGTAIEGGLTLKTDEAALGAVFVELDKAAARMEAMHNFKQIGIAMHAHHDVFIAFPNAAIVDKTGKPLLSWRVAILPFIEQDNLYKQFKLDEPWDSEHNIKLLDKMPPQYALPNRVPKSKSETFLRVFTGRDTPFDLSKARPGPVSLGLRVTAFADGTSNTLLVVESAESVPWTKPDDLPYDAKKPLPKLGGANSDRFFALIADGSVHTISKKVDEQTLRALITPGGGEVLGDWQNDPDRKRPPNRPFDRPNSEATKPPERKP